LLIFTKEGMFASTLILLCSIFFISCDYGNLISNTNEENVLEEPNLTINNFYIDPNKWELQWSDEFDDNNFDTNIWHRQIWLNPPNNEWEQYTGEPNTAYEQDGCMILKADKKTGLPNSPGNYTSARVISNPGGQNGNSGSDGKVFKYGKIAAKIQLPYGKGIWPAFWMLGDNINETGGTTPWPSCGEIDILETGFAGNKDGYWGNATLGGALHYDTSVDNKATSWAYDTNHISLNSGKFADDFHIFEIEWDATEIIWKVDGTQYFRKDISDPIFNEFRNNFYVIFNIAIGGNLTDSPDDSTVFPQYMKIDWIRHYTKIQ